MRWLDLLYEIKGSKMRTTQGYSRGPPQLSQTELTGRRMYHTEYGVHSAKLLSQSTCTSKKSWLMHTRLIHSLPVQTMSQPLKLSHIQILKSQPLLFYHQKQLGVSGSNGWLDVSMLHLRCFRGPCCMHISRYATYWMQYLARTHYRYGGEQTSASALPFKILRAPSL